MIAALSPTASWLVLGALVIVGICFAAWIIGGEAFDEAPRAARGRR
jgi:hypothetical protein